MLTWVDNLTWLFMYSDKQSVLLFLWTRSTCLPVLSGVA